MRVAVALLIVLAACVVFVLPAAHCAGDNGGNTSNSTANDDELYNDSYDAQYVDAGNNDSDPYIREMLENPPDYGAITGIILSSAGSRAIPDANVTLYDMDDNMVDLPDNPQLSSNGTGNNAGVYSFLDVPVGQYNVTAEKNGVMFFALADLRPGTATANVVLPEYVEAEESYRPPQLPTPAPKPLYYFLPIKIGKTPTQSSPDEGLPFGLAAIGGIGALLLFRHKYTEPG